jgi:hypothetical protein
MNPVQNNLNSMHMDKYVNSHVRTSSVPADLPTNSPNQHEETTKGEQEGEGPEPAEIEAIYREYLKCHIRTNRHYRKNIRNINNVSAMDLFAHTFSPCCCKKQRRKVDNAFESIFRMRSSLETCRIMESMNKLDKLLTIIFTPEQLALFNIIPNYEIGHFNRQLESTEYAPLTPKQVSFTRMAARVVQNEVHANTLSSHLFRHTIYLTDEPHQEEFLRE